MPGIFGYRPISINEGSTEIRVIDLLPVSDSPGVAACNIRHVQLHDNPVYEALSYVWGPQSPSFNVTCHDQSVRGHFNVGKNLFVALARLQLPSKMRTLWVDAMCINQSDEAEKSQQVQMMRHIYQKSNRTVIWLGDSRDDDDHDSVELAFSLISKLLKSSSLMWAKSDERNWLQMSQDEVREYQLPVSREERKEFRALKGLLDRPWFHRVRIIQESAIPAKVEILCGAYSMSWDHFSHVMQFLGKTGLEHTFTAMGGSSSTWPMLCLVRAVTQANKDISLLQLVWLAKESLATDPRDRIFALCGLTSDTSESGLNIKIDYAKSNVACNVFQETAICMINRYRNLDILSFPRRTDAVNTLGLPSWVPDWDTTHRIHALNDVHLNSSTSTASRSLDSASGTSKCDTIIGPPYCNTLLLYGIKLDTIKEVGAMANFEEYDDWIEKVKSDLERTTIWMKITDAKSNSPYNKNGESRLDAYWQTFYGGHHGVSYEEAKTIFYECYGFMKRNQFWIQCGASRYPSVFSTLIKVDGLFSYLTGATKNVRRHNYMMRVQRYRAMGISETGYMFLAPSNAKQGDCIFLLKGGSVPFLLRPVKDAPGSWELIGEAYVHGIMKGEAWNESECERIILI